MGTAKQFEPLVLLKSALLPYSKINPQVPQYSRPEWDLFVSCAKWSVVEFLWETNS